LNGGVTENLTVAGVAAAEDTYPLEISASGLSFLHSKSILFISFSFLFLFFVGYQFVYKLKKCNTNGTIKPIIILLYFI
jgi:hypothetical protein